MSLNKQRELKSLAMSPEFAKRFAAANGVVVPSKIPQGGQVYKKKPSRVQSSNWERKTRMTCSICGSGCQDKRDLRDHFVVCVGRNGNPTGACWDDSLKPNEAVNRSSNRSSASSRDSSTPAAHSSDHTAELDGGFSKSEKFLAAVEISQFDLSAGQLSSPGGYDRDKPQVHPYTIDDREFVMRHPVRSHSPTCVKQNENPTGALSNGAWNSAASPAGQMGTQSSSRFLDPESEYKFEDAEYDGPDIDTFLPNTFIYPDPQLISAPPCSLRPSHPYFQQVDW